MARILPCPASAEPRRPPGGIYEGASCADLEPSLFDGGDVLSTLRAKAICCECPVRVDCLSWAMEFEPYGIWGGMTARERDVARGWKLVAGVDERAAADHLRRRLAANVTIAELARELGVSRRTLERWKAADSKAKEGRRAS